MLNQDKQWSECSKKDRYDMVIAAINHLQPNATLPALRQRMLEICPDARLSWIPGAIKRLRRLGILESQRRGSGRLYNQVNYRVTGSLNLYDTGPSR